MVYFVYVTTCTYWSKVNSNQLNAFHTFSSLVDMVYIFLSTSNTVMNNKTDPEARRSKKTEYIFVSFLIHEHYKRCSILQSRRKVDLHLANCFVFGFHIFGIIGFLFIELSIFYYYFTFIFYQIIFFIE